MLTTREAIQKLLDNIRLGIIQDQEDKKIRASGESAKSLKSKTKEVSGNITGTLTGAGYFYFQEYGRSPGKMPPVQSIKDWIEAKGMARGAMNLSDNRKGKILRNDKAVESLAWAIAIKIKKSGTKAKRNESPRLAVLDIIEAEMDASRDEIRKAMFYQFKTNTTKILKTSFE
jgi:hypothetical protein